MVPDIKARWSVFSTSVLLNILGFQTFIFPNQNQEEIPIKWQKFVLEISEWSYWDVDAILFFSFGFKA